MTHEQKTHKEVNSKKKDNHHLNGHHEYEYRVCAVIDDEEIGHYSNVVLVTV